MSSLIKKISPWSLAVFVAAASFAQTVFIPSGTSGIGSSTNSNVGIGTSAPGEKLQVKGNLSFESANTSVFRVVPEPTTNDRILQFENGSSTGTGGFAFKATDAGFNAVRLKISNNGNVGIGTTSPSYRLDLRTPGLASSQFHLASTDTDAGGYITSAGDSNFYFAAGASWPGSTAWIAKATSYGILGTHGGVINFFTGSGVSVGAPITLSERMRIDATGNVGIGRTSPNSILEVGGRITLLEGNRYWSVGAGRADGPGNGYPDGAVVADGSFAIRDVWWQRDRLRIDSNGNVGIGTTTPSHKLAVNGTIRAREIIVDNTNWSDFVFEEDYRLAPLVEVEAHIKMKKHLPGIPSAAAIAENGASLGEMQARLLAKVEELTLHLIAQEKRLNEQAARISTLEKENSQLRQP